jgi:hypothetical protein
MAILAQRFKDTSRINITLRVQRFQTVLFYMVFQTRRYQYISNWEMLLWVSLLGSLSRKREKERETKSYAKSMALRCRFLASRANMVRKL